jgi:hypothetical protein
VFDATEPGARAEGCGPICVAVEDDGEEERISPIWRFVERDPTFARLEAVTEILTLTFSATLDRGILELALTVTNTSRDQLRLRLALDAAPDTVLASDTFSLAHNRVYTIVATIP